jgi:hypothetical protein
VPSLSSMVAASAPEGASAAPTNAGAASVGAKRPVPMASNHPRAGATAAKGDSITDFGGRR